MIHFSISFGIKFKCFILAHRVLYCQASACLFSIACVFPTCTLHFSQLDHVQFPQWVTVIHGFVFFRTFLPCEKLSPSADTVTGLVLEGPLCVLVLSTFHLPVTLSSSHSLGMCCVLLPALILLLLHPCQLRLCLRFRY